MESQSSHRILKTGPVSQNGLKKSGIPTPVSKTRPPTTKAPVPSKPKANNENVQPPKPGVARSATASTITRKNVIVPRVASKRPAMLSVTTSTAGASKRAKVTATKAAAVPKPAAETTEADLVKLIDWPKPNKWDWKGRVAYTAEELRVLKLRYEEVLQQYTSTKDVLTNLRENEQDYQMKSEKLEEEQQTLLKKMEEMTEQINELVEKKEDLTKRLKDLEEKEEKMSVELKETQERCAIQKIELSEEILKNKMLDEKVTFQAKTIEEVTSNRDQLQTVLHKMDQERRALHNMIQDLKGKIRVFCRVRPRTEKEHDRKMCTLHFVEETSIEVARAADMQESCGKIRSTRQEFTFDKVFPPTATQAQVFEELELLVDSALEGYNVCVFAYGQTGSGKTYTMEGNRNRETEGMIPRTVRHIFEEMKKFELLGWQYTVEASILEIYNEHIVDLLDSEQKTHEIRMVDNQTNDLYVTNLHIEPIDCPEKLHECLLVAQRNRAVAATSANERSSRSHSVTRIRLIGRHSANNEICVGNLNLVDLAGSERLKNEEASRTVETKSINKSLSNLGNVILALAKKQDHVPYRNSKLTHILMPSLGGNSKTLMLLNISPLDECFNETINSLRFASTVNSCRVGQVKRQKTVLNST